MFAVGVQDALRPGSRLLCAATGLEAAMNVTPTQQNGYSAIKILRLPQVCEVTGFCRSMIYQMEAEHRFPKRVKIGTRAVGWLEGEVRAWLQTRIELSRA
jgi:prophage regulatory protein